MSTTRVVIPTTDPRFSALANDAMTGAARSPLASGRWVTIVSAHVTDDGLILEVKDDVSP